jgi:hypothetical protein
MEYEPMTDAERQEAIDRAYARLSNSLRRLRSQQQQEDTTAPEKQDHKPATPQTDTDAS